MTMTGETIHGGQGKQGNPRHHQERKEEPYLCSEAQRGRGRLLLRVLQASRVALFHHRSHIAGLTADPEQALKSSPWMAFNP